MKVPFTAAAYRPPSGPWRHQPNAPRPPVAGTWRLLSESMKPERWMRPAVLASGVVVTGSGLVLGLQDRDGGTVIGVLLIGLVLLVVALFEPRLLELTASFGKSAKMVVKLRDALSTAQAVAEVAMEKTEQLADPEQLRDAIASTSEAIDSIAETFVLSGPKVAVKASDLKLWPFAGFPVKVPDGVALDLVAKTKGDGTEPIEVMCVVTDPMGRTFTREKRLDAVASRLLLSFKWPDDYTSGDDIPPGRHKVDWFVAPVAVGPRRRFQHVASASFPWSPSDQNALRWPFSLDPRPVGV